MQELSAKELDPALSPLFVDAVHDALREYDGRRVGASRPCPRCGSTGLRRNGYQREPKTFARLVTEAGFEEVGVQVQQFECTDCGRSFQADISEFFYEGCAYAKPVVDLCRFHAAESTYAACERRLQDLYGVQVDCDTVQRYEDRFADTPDTSQAVVVGGRKVSLPFLAFLFGDGFEDSSHFVFTSHTALW